MNHTIALMCLISVGFPAAVSRGGHTLHIEHGCELDVEGRHGGSFHIFYEGEDFLDLDLNTVTWTAANANAEMFVKGWKYAGREANHWKTYLSNTCVEWLKLYLLCRTDPTERKVSQTLQYVMAITPGSNTTTGELDGELFVYFGSNVTEVVPKTTWILNITHFEPNYWMSERDRMLREHDNFQHLLNQAAGVLDPTEVDQADVDSTGEEPVARSDGVPLEVITALAVAAPVAVAAVLGLIIWRVKKNCWKKRAGI